MMPSTSGSIWNPATVGLDPFTTCRYCGRSSRPPNIPMPTIAEVLTPTAKVRERNIRSGRMPASPARRSIARNAANPTAPIA